MVKYFLNSKGYTFTAEKKGEGYIFLKCVSFLHTSRRVFCNLTGLGDTGHKSTQNVHILGTFVCNLRSFQRLRSEVPLQSRSFRPALKGDLRSGCWLACWHFLAKSASKLVEDSAKKYSFSAFCALFFVRTHHFGLQVSDLGKGF